MDSTTVRFAHFVIPFVAFFQYEDKKASLGSSVAPALNAGGGAGGGEGAGGDKRRQEA